MNELLEIGIFQFENLVRGRVPFALLKVSGDVSQLFLSYLQEPLDRNTFDVTADSLMAFVEEKKFTKDQAFVVACADGTKSPALAQTLFNLGFGNVYYLKEGTTALREYLKPNSPKA